MLWLCRRGSFGWERTTVGVLGQTKAWRREASPHGPNQKKGRQCFVAEEGSDAELDVGSTVGVGGGGGEGRARPPNIMKEKRGSLRAMSSLAGERGPRERCTGPVRRRPFGKGVYDIGEKREKRRNGRPP